MRQTQNIWSFGNGIEQKFGNKPIQKEALRGSYRAHDTMHCKRGGIKDKWKTREQQTKICQQKRRHENNAKWKIKWKTREVNAKQKRNKNKTRKKT